MTGPPGVMQGQLDSGQGQAREKGESSPKTTATPTRTLEGPLETHRGPDRAVRFELTPLDKRSTTPALRIDEHRPRLIWIQDRQMIDLHLGEWRENGTIEGERS